MFEMKKNIADIILQQCFDTLVKNGIYFERGTLVLTLNESKRVNCSNLSVVFVGDEDV